MKQRQKRLLLTGGTGFIGRGLASLAIADGWEVHCLVRDRARCPLGTMAIDADLSRGAIGSPPSPIDCVVHLAQASGSNGAPASVSELFAVNTAGTASLLELAHRSGATTFVLASTGSVYSGAIGPCDEAALVRPTDHYSATKLAAESLLPPYSGTMRTVALRLFTPYGPGQNDRLIPRLIARVSKGDPVTLDGDEGGLRIAAGYIDDVARTFLAAAEEGWEGVFNVAAPESTCIRDLALAIGRRLGVAPRFERSGRPEPSPLIPKLDRLAVKCDLSRFCTFEEGLRLTLPALLRRPSDFAGR